MRSLAFKELFAPVKYKVAGYVRLSRDEDKGNYTSIVAQKEIIARYVDEINSKGEESWELTDFYEDDNVSGYTFEREGFLELLEKLEDGKIDIVIAKDLSRIGRHNAKTLLFMENIRKLDKRCILIEEGAGGYDTNSDDDDIIGIKTWYNERYIKDISRKIRSNIKALQHKGEFLVEAHYGYKKDPNNKGNVIIDELYAPYVREVFNKFVNGWGCRKIALHFTDKQIPTPATVLYERKIQEGKKTKTAPVLTWSQGTIYRLIKNDFYIGIHRCGKKVRKGIHGKVENVSEEKQVILYDHHESIIDQATFELAQQLLEKRNIGKFRSDGLPKTKQVNIYAGFLFCADCGSYMTAVNKSDRAKAYRCGRYNMYGLKVCTSHFIREEDLTKIFREILTTIKDNLSDMILSYNNTVHDILNKEQNFDGAIKKLQKELELLQNEFKLYIIQKTKEIARNPHMEDALNGTYNELMNENQVKCKMIQEQLNELEITKKNSMILKTKSKNAIDIFTSIIEKEVYDRRDMELLIEKIVIDKDGIPTFHLKPQLQAIVSISDTEVHSCSALRWVRDNYVPNLMEIIEWFNDDVKHVI